MGATLGEANQRRWRAMSWQPWAVGLAGLVVGLWGVTTPSLWRDEAISAQLARGGLGAITQLAGFVDAVHVPYYVFLSGWVAIFGDSELALRFPSVLAIAIAAAFGYLLTARHVDQLGALIGAVLFLAVPATSRYAQEARVTAIVIALVVVSTYVLVVSVERDSPQWWIGYAVLLVLTVGFSVVAAYALVAHAALIVASHRDRLRVWAVSAVPALPVAVVLAVIASSQSAALSWLPDPTPAQFVLGIYGLFESPNVAAVVVLAALVATGVLIARKRLLECLQYVVFAAAPIAFWLVSQVSNIYLARYFEFAVPFLCMLIAIGLRRWYLSAVITLLVAVVAMPAAIAIRQPDGHYDDFRAVVTAVAAQWQPGDAVDMQRWETRAGWDYYADHLDAPDPTRTADFSEEIVFEGGRTCDASTFADYERVWFVALDMSVASAQKSPADCDPSLRAVQSEKVGGLLVTLFARS